jgi:hypothetical protein
MSEKQISKPDEYLYENKTKGPTTKNYASLHFLN